MSAAAASPPGNPYVAGRSDGTGYWLEGASTFSDVQSLVTDAVSDHDALAAVFDAGGVALDVLGDIGDPLGAALGCAVGWIIDHISFLRDPVDWLAGDPDGIQASIQTWEKVAAAMAADADTLAAQVRQLGPPTWSGEAADAYRRRAADWVQTLQGGATLAGLEGALIAATGGLCAAVRSLIFQLIGDAVERWLLAGLIALANSAWTFGASLAAWVIDVEIEAGLLAASIGAKIAELVEKAGRIATTLARDGSRFEQLAVKVTEASEKMLHDVRSTRSLLGWDRRWSHQDRAGHALADATHLRQDLQRATALMHLGVPQTVVPEAGAIARESENPSAANVDQLVQTTARTAARKAAGAAAHHGQQR